MYFALGFSPDGRYLATAVRARDLRLSELSPVAGPGPRAEVFDHFLVENPLVGRMLVDDRHAARRLREDEAVVELP